MEFQDVMAYMQTMHDQSIQKDLEIARLKLEAEQRDESRITVEEELRNDLETLEGKVKDLEAKSEKKDQKIGELLMKNEELEERIKELEGAEHMETEQPEFHNYEQPDMEFHTRVIKLEYDEELEPEQPEHLQTDWTEPIRNQVTAKTEQPGNFYDEQLQTEPVGMVVVKTEQPEDIEPEQPTISPVLVETEQPIRMAEQPTQGQVAVNTEQPDEIMEPEQPEDEDPADRTNRRIMEILHAVRHEQPVQPEQSAGQKAQRIAEILRDVRTEQPVSTAPTTSNTLKRPHSPPENSQDAEKSKNDEKEKRLVFLNKKLKMASGNPSEPLPERRVRQPKKHFDL